MKRLLEVLACSAFALAVMVAPAVASIRYGSFGGFIVSSSPNDLNLFGGGSLLDLPITGTFSFDSDPSHYQSVLASPPDLFETSDTSGLPLIGFTLTVNGVTQSISGTDLSETFVYSAAQSSFYLGIPAPTFGLDGGDQFSGGLLILFDVFSQTFDPALGLDQPDFRFATLAGIGQFGFSDPLGGPDTTQFFVILDAARVPEPASLILLATGLAGLVLRRRAALPA